jgi:hypothetical protein
MGWGWETGGTGTGSHGDACGAKQKKDRAAQRGTKRVRICASACHAVCPTPLAVVENLNARSSSEKCDVYLDDGEGDIISAHHMVLHDTEQAQASTMDQLYDFHGGEYSARRSISRSSHQLAHRAQARSGSRGLAE